MILLDFRVSPIFSDVLPSPMFMFFRDSSDVRPENPRITRKRKPSTWSIISWDGRREADHMVRHARTAPQAKHRQCRSHCSAFSHAEMAALTLITWADMPELRIKYQVKYRQCLSHCLTFSHAEMAALKLTTSAAQINTWRRRGNGKGGADVAVVVAVFLVVVFWIINVFPKIPTTTELFKCPVSLE